MSKNKYNIALLGGRGYVGQEIIKLLNKHPVFNLSMAFSKSLAEKNVEGYIKNSNLKYTKLSLESLSLPDVDIVICALGNGESSSYIDQIEKINNSIIIIDIGSDYRFDDKWSYSVPEIHNEKITFSPHVAECVRGILVTSHFSLDQKTSESEVYEIFKEFYLAKKLIKVDKSPPLISNVINTNLAGIGGFSLGDDGKSLVVCSVIDNLLKGAATQCIQNLNAAFGIEDSLYLEDTHI